MNLKTIFADFALFAVKLIKHRKVIYEPWFENEHEKNNELKRNETNAESASSYGVRPSSLFIFLTNIRVNGGI